MIRRINLFAGPSAGKSTLATYLFYRLKCAGYNVEYAPEYVKKWTYYHRVPKSFDQVYLFAKQLHNEDSILNGGFDFVLCDSPLMLTYFYALKYRCPAAEHLFAIAQEFERQFPSYDMFIERGTETYQSVGRFQNLSEAVEIDDGINLLMPGLANFKYNDADRIYNSIITKIGDSNGKG